MTDQNTIDEVTARLTGKAIRIYSRFTFGASFVVSVTNDSLVHQWAYSARSKVARNEAYAKAIAFADVKRLLTGYPIVDETL